MPLSIGMSIETRAPTLALQRPALRGVLHLAGALLATAGTSLLLLVAAERSLVAAGIHSRRRAADELGVADPDAEFGRWLEEQERLSAGEAARSENGRAAVGREG